MSDHNRLALLGFLFFLLLGVSSHAATVHFVSGEVVEPEGLNEGENLRKIKLTRLLESSGSIAQYQFVYMDHNDLPEQDDSEGGFGDDTDFDNLWSTL
jgi:hypothetical protein